MCAVAFDLVTPKSNQFIGSASNIHDLSLAAIHQSILEITRSRAVFCIHNVHCGLWTFDLVTLKSNQFFGFARYIHDQSLAGIHQLVLQITRSRAVFAYIMSPVTFDLVTPKSNQFIGSARSIPDQSLAGIHQLVLQITRSRERDVRTDVRTDGQPEKHNASGYFVNGGIKITNCVLTCAVPHLISLILLL